MAKRKNKKIIVKRNRLKGNTATVNRKYKDTVFRMLFSDRKNLLSLYNAINETSYTDAAQLEIVTLENAIYMGMKNDLAFIINTNLFLYEHQSTYNPNMPLRDLFYISSEYQKMVDWKSLYTSTRLRIPTPNFIVFYNGTEKKEDKWVDYLSESYENMSGEPNLELKVITLNINVGHNKKLMEECQTLREYAQYVAKVRRYSEEMELNTAVERAVSESIQEGILKEFLQKNRAHRDCTGRVMLCPQSDSLSITACIPASAGRERHPAVRIPLIGIRKVTPILKLQITYWNREYG